MSARELLMLAYRSEQKARLGPSRRGPNETIVNRMCEHKQFCYNCDLCEVVFNWGERIRHQLEPRNEFSTAANQLL